MSRTPSVVSATPRIEFYAGIAARIIGVHLGIGRGSSPARLSCFRSWAQVLNAGPKKMLRDSRTANKISNDLLALKKERMPANIAKLSGIAVPSVQQQPPPVHGTTRAHAVTGSER